MIEQLPIAPTFGRAKLPLGRLTQEHRHTSRMFEHLTGRAAALPYQHKPLLSVGLSCCLAHKRVNIVTPPESSNTLPDAQQRFPTSLWLPNTW